MQPLLPATPDDLRSYTKEQYDQTRAALEAKGYTVLTKWRPGLKRIRLGDIVLTPNPPAEEITA